MKSLFDLLDWFTLDTIWKEVHQACMAEVCREIREIDYDWFIHVTAGIPCLLNEPAVFYRCHDQPFDDRETKLSVWQEEGDLAIMYMGRRVTPARNRGGYRALDTWEENRPTDLPGGSYSGCYNTAVCKRRLEGQLYREVAKQKTIFLKPSKIYKDIQS